MTISHVRPSDHAIQSNDEHSQGVARLAEQFAAEFGFGEWGRIMGLLHDKGKEQPEFQRYIKHQSGLSTDKNAPSKVQHAYVGALLMRNFQKTGWLMSFPVYGHHSGLHDFGEQRELFNRQLPAGIATGCSLAEPKLPAGFKPTPNDVHHLVRMLYSCLVDADFLDTEAFMNAEQSALRNGKKTLAELKPMLDKYLNQLAQGAEATPVNAIRAKIQASCLEAANGAPGFYSLTVPTGGGKTLSSLVWAINHAITHHKKRIIIVIPYTSIITQTARILAGIFGTENVLEHHSNADFHSDLDDDVNKMARLATENWDYPIVVTTNVRLFESMHSNRPGVCRKLHNICNSVMILDEVQTFPAELLQPILDALNSYQRLFATSVLFTTASMPAIGKSDWEEFISGNKLEGITRVTDIVPASWQLHKQLKRTQIIFDDGKPQSIPELVLEISRHERVLCIVNTRDTAREIFEHLPNDGHNYHLSKMMHANHISATLNKIQGELKQPGTIRVVATQLVEAGVDFDFPVVYRERIGLDSIIQAAGRCNREGKLQLGEVHVFALANKRLPGVMNTANDARLNMPANLDVQSPEAMHEYFLQFYRRVGSFDEHGLRSLYMHPKEISFKELSLKFKYIDDKDQIGIVIDCPATHKIIAQLQNDAITYAGFAVLSRHTVAVGRHNKVFSKLKETGQLIQLGEDLYAVNARHYDAQVGLRYNNELIVKPQIV